MSLVGITTGFSLNGKSDTLNIITGSTVAAEQRQTLGGIRVQHGSTG